jgi:ElaB/YqjD/DUF883 family membrane-anchored ribosome-binding protein
VGRSGAGAATAKERIAEKAAQIQDKVSDIGRKTVDRIDQSRETAADALDQTASTLHSGGDRVSGAAHSAADSIQATANYVRRTNLKGMAGDVQDIVARYPAIALTAAAVFGFLVGRTLRTED